MKKTFFLLIFCGIGYLSLYAQTGEYKRVEAFPTPEEMPAFPGGEEKCNQYIKDNLKYPQEAITNEIEGKVWVNFIIDKDGTINNISVIRGLSKECDAEAIRIIQNMPKWLPGKTNGIPVATKLNLPIRFTLTEK
jgi:protein TonB